MEIKFSWLYVFAFYLWQLPSFGSKLGLGSWPYSFCFNSESYYVLGKYIVTKCKHGSYTLGLLLTYAVLLYKLGKDAPFSDKKVLR